MTETERSACAPPRRRGEIALQLDQDLALTIRLLHPRDGSLRLFACDRRPRYLSEGEHELDVRIDQLVEMILVSHDVVRSVT